MPVAYEELKMHKGKNKINKLRKDFMTLISIFGGNLNISLIKKDFQFLFSSEEGCHH